MTQLIIYGQPMGCFDRHYCGKCWKTVTILVQFITGEWPENVRTYVRDPFPMV